MRKVTFALAIVAGAFTVADSAVAQQNPGHFSLGNYGRSHGYLSMPVYCGIAKCGDNWRVPGQPQANNRARVQRERQCAGRGA
jgi:hypothetical protein